MKSKLVLALLATASLLVVTGAMAEEAMSPQQTCEQGAEEAGLTESADVNAYIQTCLEDMGAAPQEGESSGQESSGN